MSAAPDLENRIAAGPRTVPLTGMRGAIARNMEQGWSVPRVAQSIEADVTALQDLRAAAGEGERSSLTAYVLRAVALCLREHPRLNARLPDREIEVIDDINLGLAVSLGEGLMVPVLRNADRKSTAELAAEARALAEGVRTGSLSPGSYQRGTFTVTSLAGTAIDSFTPILNAPQVAILGVTRVTAKPVARGNAVAVAPMMGLHLVFDHRAVDGFPAALFLGALKHRLETAEGL